MKMNRKGPQSRKKFAAGGGVGAASPVRGRGNFSVDPKLLRNLVSGAGIDPGLLSRINARVFGNITGAGAQPGFQKPTVQPAVQAPKARIASKAGRWGGRVKKTGIQAKGHTKGRCF